MHATQATTVVVVGVLVEDAVNFTLAELSQACRVDSERVAALVTEGVLNPSGDSAASWQLDGDALRRARSALRLAHDLELNAADAGFVLDLLDELDALRARLHRLGGSSP